MVYCDQNECMRLHLNIVELYVEYGSSQSKIPKIADIFDIGAE